MTKKSTVTQQAVSPESDNKGYLGNTNLERAAEFIAATTRENGTVSYETFAEDELAPPSEDGRHSARRLIHGPFSDHAGWLAKLNEQADGIFLVLNDIAHLARLNENVVNIRAVLVRVDESSLEDVKQCGLEPHIITEEAAKIYCCFWLVSDVSPEMFPLIQQAIAEKFNSDQGLTDPALLVRIPGFINYKGEPFRANLRKCKDFPPYTMEQIVDGLKISDLIQAREHENVSVEMAPAEDSLPEDDAAVAAPPSPEPETLNGSQDVVQLTSSDSDSLGLDAEKTLAILPEGLRINEKYRDMFPPMDPETYAKTKESIRSRGIENPIAVTADGTIIDGYHRHRIWGELNAEGIEKDLPYEVKHFESEEEIVEFLRVQNEYRRHLDVLAAARAAIADLPATQENLEQERRESQGKTQRGEKNPNKTTRKATAIAGAKHGVSGATVEQVRMIDESGEQDIITDLNQRRISPSTGAKRVRERKAQRKKATEGESNPVPAEAAAIDTTNVGEKDSTYVHTSMHIDQPDPTLEGERPNELETNQDIRLLKRVKALLYRTFIRSHYGT